LYEYISLCGNRGFSALEVLCLYAM